MAIINGTNNRDILIGSDVGDIIRGLGGDDELFGFNGDDQLLGGGGADYLRGGVGTDRVDGGAGADSIGGGAGNDVLVGGGGVDTATYVGSLGGVSVNLATGFGIGGDAEGDRLEGIENLIGTLFDDVLIGNDAANVLTGGTGLDQLFGGGGNDVLQGGPAFDLDILDGGAGVDVVSYAQATESVGVNLLVNSGDKGDTLIGIENVDGSSFGDFLYGDNRDNRLQGFDGEDELIGFIGDDVLIGGNGDDELFGGASNDTLDGGAGADHLNGELGNDSLYGGAGADFLNGERGNDTLSYATSSAGVDVSLNPADGLGEGGDAEGDRLFNIENLTGSAFLDALAGSAGDNVLAGGGGADFLIGDSGNDRFDYTALNQGGDGIADFSNVAGNDDRLGFEGDAFGNLPVGALAANRFVANASGLATSLDQRFVYETDTGILRYDANGSAAGGVTVIAVLAGAPILTAADFEII